MELKYSSERSLPNDGNVAGGGIEPGVTGSLLPPPGDSRQLKNTWSEAGPRCRPGWAISPNAKTLHRVLGNSCCSLLGLIGYRRLGALKNRHLYSYRSGGSQAKTKMLAGLVPSEGSEGDGAMPPSCFGWSAGVS